MSLTTRLLVCVCVCTAPLLAPAAKADDDPNPTQVLRAYEEAQTAEAAEKPSQGAESKSPETTGSLAPASVQAPSARDRLMPLIEKAARDNAIPPALLEAVVRVESRYNPAVQNRGALGLMQIKLATARGIGFAGDASALLKPETNLHWGAKYLARAYQLSGGDTCLTLARYQGGHGVAKMGPSGRAYCAKVRTVLAQLD